MNKIFKHFREITIILFVLIISFSLKAETFEYEGLMYETVSENEVEVSYWVSYKTPNSDTYNQVIIPDQIGNFTVVGIGDIAFLQCKELTTLQIPETLRYIGERAFEECISLSQLEIPDNVSSIGWGAFASCYSLKSIVLLYESLLYQERFIHLLQCAGILSQRCGDSRKTHRSSLEFINNSEKNPIVDFIKSIPVDIEGFKSVTGYIKVDSPSALHHCEIPHPSQKGICNSRSASASQSYFQSGIIRYLHIQKLCRTFHDAL